MCTEQQCPAQYACWLKSARALVALHTLGVCCSVSLSQHTCLVSVVCFLNKSQSVTTCTNPTAIAYRLYCLAIHRCLQPLVSATTRPWHMRERPQVSEAASSGELSTYGHAVQAQCTALASPASMHGHFTMQHIPTCCTAIAVQL